MGQQRKGGGISFLASFPYTCLQMHCSKASKLLCNEISKKETSNQFRKLDQKTKALHIEEIERHDSFVLVTLTFPLFITMSFFLTAGKPYPKMKKPTSIIWSKKSTPTPPPSCTQQNICSRIRSTASKWRLSTMQAVPGLAKILIHLLHCEKVSSQAKNTIYITVGFLGKFQDS